MNQLSFSWIIAVFVLSACDSAIEEGVEVVLYQGPPLTEESVQQGHLTWIATVDTVWRQVSLEMMGDGGEVEHRLQFQEDPRHLPLFLGYSQRPDSLYAATLRFGKIYIQNFDLGGEISGRFEGSLFRPLGARTGSIFWIDVSRENVCPDGRFTSAAKCPLNAPGTAQ
jgi:hypothetical protein